MAAGATPPRCVTFGYSCERCAGLSHRDIAPRSAWRTLTCRRARNADASRKAASWLTSCSVWARMFRKSLRNGYAAAAALALLMDCAPKATAGLKAPLPIAHVPRGNLASPELRSFLQARLERELTALDLGGDTWPLGYTADASIVKLEGAEHSGGGRVSCTVALTLLDSEHSPVAIVRGNASAEGAASNPRLSRDAVRGAAHSAVSQLPTVFRKVRQRK